MGYTCGLLLLILLPFSTGKLSDLVKDFEYYKNITVGAVGLKQYAEYLSNTVDYMKREAIDEYLGNSGKAALDELSSGLIQVRDVLVKAAGGVTTIKEHSSALLLVLSLSGITEQEKVEMAVQLLSTLSKDSKAEIKEFVNGLLQANRTLEKSKRMLHSILQRLYQLKEDNKADTESTQNFHYAAMGIEAALGAAGAVAFGWPLAAPLGALFGIHTLLIDKNDKNFLEQQGKINDHIDGYEIIYKKTDIVCEGVDVKIKQVQEVYGKYGTTATVAGEQFSINPTAQCELIQQLAEALVKACDIFL